MKNRALATRHPIPASALTPQYDQLLPEDRILGLKPRDRSQRQDQDDHNEPE
jgi:hypothetical protein